MAAVEGNANAAFRPNEGHVDGVQALGQSPTEPAVKFGNAFNTEETGELRPSGADAPGVRKSSRDYSATDEWDASKVPPSRFQQRKGSVFATPPSRDGHVQRNRDNDTNFHTAHSKRFSFSRAKDMILGGTGGSDKSEGHRRKSSSGSAGSPPK